MLDAHNRTSSRSIYGTVSAARIDNGRGLATIQLSRTADAAPIVDRIREGSLRNVSIGYQVLSVREERTNGQRTLVATRWKPKELSFVPLGADPAARVRGDADAGQIRSMATLMGLPAGVRRSAGDALTHGGAGACRDLGRAATECARDQSRGSLHHPRRGRGPRRAHRRRPADAHGPQPRARNGRPYTYCRMADVARICLETRGLSTLGSPAMLIERAMHTIGDFPNVLAELFNKTLSTITRTPSPVVQLFRSSTVPNFYSKHFMDISDGPLLQQVNEAGEVSFGTITDKTLASYKAASYAKGFTISFESLVNDNLAALQDISAKMTRGARGWFEAFLVGIIVSNPLLADGQAVFSAAHKNLSATPAAPSDPSIAEGKLGMRLQQDLSGNPLNLMPKYIFVPAALETTVDQLLAQLYPRAAERGRGRREDGLRTRSWIAPRLDQAGQTKSWYPARGPCDSGCRFRVFGSRRL